MLRNNIILGMLIVNMILFAWCTAPGSTTTSKNTVNPDRAVVGGVAVGISPKLTHADRGDNISFTVDLLSTENAEDVVTVSI